jgi:phosphoribosyl 1,2-cyclic phosphate phosphodiesterase
MVRGSRVLVVNALRLTEHHSHLNLDEALALAGIIGAERTYFTHISHLLGKHAEVSAKLPDGVAIAFDGLTISL